MRLIVTSILLLASMQANAILVEAMYKNHGDGLITIDTETHLQWLDLTQTTSMSYDYVGSQFGVGGLFHGFRYATEAEFESLMDAIIPSYSGNALGYQTATSESAVYAQTVYFQSLLGVTDNRDTVFDSFGFYRDNSGVMRTGGTSRNFDTAFVYRDYYFNYNDLATVGTPWHGTFLVRGISVPEPTGLALFGLGIAGMVFSRRKLL